MAFRHPDLGPRRDCTGLRGMSGGGQSNAEKTRKVSSPAVAKGLRGGGLQQTSRPSPAAGAGQRREGSGSRGVRGAASSRGSQVCWPGSLRAEAPQRPQPRGAASTAGLAVCLELCPLAPAFPQTASLVRPQTGAGGRRAERAAPGGRGRRLPRTEFREGQSAVWGGGGERQPRLCLPVCSHPQGSSRSFCIPVPLALMGDPASLEYTWRRGLRGASFFLQNGHQGKSETKTPGVWVQAEWRTQEHWPRDSACRGDASHT